MKQMNRFEIHQTRAFRKQLQTMRRAGKKERALAGRAEAIIRRLQADPLDEKAACRRTYNGELRLRDCRKYNLSCGFRLIGLKRDNRLIFTCIGSHDDCRKWIENNRDVQDEIDSQPIPAIPIRDSRKARSGVSVSTKPVTDDEYEEQLMNRLDDHLLREIFSGLCRRAAAG
jgi:mRNA-degrading endonuclease YafQ of YafQ-DinJ toxin-antitoxin module